MCNVAKAWCYKRIGMVNTSNIKQTRCKGMSSCMCMLNGPWQHIGDTVGVRRFQHTKLVIFYTSHPFCKWEQGGNMPKEQLEFEFGLWPSPSKIKTATFKLTAPTCNCKTLAGTFSPCSIWAKLKSSSDWQLVQFPLHDFQQTHVLRQKYDSGTRVFWFITLPVWVKTLKKSCLAIPVLVHFQSFAHELNFFFI